jgi:hypothetical protein
LIPEATGRSNFEIVRANGQTEPIDVDFEVASQLVKEAAAAAKSAKIAWNAKDLVVNPQKELIDIVVQSRKLALQEEAEEREEAEE